MINCLLKNNDINKAHRLISIKYIIIIHDNVVFPVVCKKKNIDKCDILALPRLRETNNELTSCILKQTLCLNTLWTNIITLATVLSCIVCGRRWDFR